MNITVYVTEDMVGHKLGRCPRSYKGHTGHTAEDKAAAAQQTVGELWQELKTKNNRKVETKEVKKKNQLLPGTRCQP